MRITKDQATKLVDTYCGDEPRADAIERAVAHEWTFDVLADHWESGCHQDEVDAVLYGS